jgi:hypothetical protein
MGRAVVNASIVSTGMDEANASAVEAASWTSERGLLIKLQARMKSARTDNSKSLYKRDIWSPLRFAVFMFIEVGMM